MELDFHTQLRLRLGKAVASSIRANKRNLESPFYGVYDLWLQKLIGDHSSLLVVPQYTLWFEPGLLNAQEELGGQEVADGVEGDGWVEDPNLADVSTDTTLSAFLSDLGREKIPDFVVLNIRAMPLPAGNPRFELLEGIWITGELCPLVMECKRGPKGRTGVEVPDAITFQLSLAKTQLFQSCVHAFMKYGTMQQVIAIATSGIYWSYRIITRANVASEDIYDALQWNGEEGTGYYRLQFDPNAQVHDQATIAVRNHLMALPHELPELPGVPAQ